MIKVKISRWRGLVALGLLVVVVVGLVVNTGLGTPSALGWRDIAAICPVGALEVMAGVRGFLLHPFILLVAVVAIAFFVGKAFCSWACPVPHLRHFFRPQKEKKDAEKAEGAAGHCASCAASCSAATAGKVPAKGLVPVGGKRDGLQLDSRHAVLAGAVGTSFLFGFPVFCLVCPVGLSFATVIGLWNLFRFNETSWGLVIIPLILIAEIVLFRRWCTTFCPISALLSLVAAKSPFLRPVVEKSSCLRSKGVDCRACVAVCPEAVDPHSPSIPECSRCGECVAACPAGAVSIPLRAKGAAPEKQPSKSREMGLDDEEMLQPIEG